MRILLTNDDGIRAPGIIAMHEAFRNAVDAGNVEILVVAPDTVQSATSHGVTFHEPLMVNRVRVPGAYDGYAVGGRPADCVKLAIAELWPAQFGAGSKPDLVISGMNAGANCGINVIYSGTVAAALEAAFLGSPSIAVSLHLGPGRAMFDVAASRAKRAIDRILSSQLLGTGSCVSINVPRTEEPDDEIARASDPEQMPVGTRRRAAAGPRPDLVASMPDPELVVCPMNTHGMVDRFEKRESPSGETYYWASGGGTDFQGTDDETDVHHLLEGKTTVTPLIHDLTDASNLPGWAGALI
ncbi:MAG: 5'/3'-nucleotidase SurE [Planctomycetota bacterium]